MLCSYEFSKFKPLLSNVDQLIVYFEPARISRFRGVRRGGLFSVGNLIGFAQSVLGGVECGLNGAAVIACGLPAGKPAVFATALVRVDVLLGECFDERRCELGRVNSRRRWATIADRELSVVLTRTGDI